MIAPDALVRAARARREPGTSLLRAAPVGPADAHRRQWHELAALLAGLGNGEWHAVTSSGVSVHELVAHLVAQQRWVARSLFRAGRFAPPPGTEGDHWGLSWPTIERLRARPPAVAVAELAAAVGLVVDVAAATPAERWGRGAVRLDDAFAARTFELWIHADDIRRATGRPFLDPDRARLDRLCRLAATFVPLGMEAAGTAAPGRTMRLVLTGPGGGTWVQPLGLTGLVAPAAAAVATGGAADVTIVAPGARFCRVAGRLLDPTALDAHVEGDASLVPAVLAGVRAFAE